MDYTINIFSFVKHEKSYSATGSKPLGIRNALESRLGKGETIQKIRFWIQYPLSGGKQRKEFVGYSIEEARDADGKRRSQKRENRIFDIKPEAKRTFEELKEWYLVLNE